VLRTRRAWATARPILDRARVFIERPWRSSQDDGVDLHACASGTEARTGIGKWLTCDNAERPHPALGGRPPDEAHKGNDDIRSTA
jgi:putative transposase